MAARIGIERGDANEAVHAVLGLEPAIGVAALDRNGRRLDAGFLALGLFQICDLVTVLLRPTPLLNGQRGGPVRATSALSCCSAASASAMVLWSFSASPSSIMVWWSSSSCSMRAIEPS